MTNLEGKQIKAAQAWLHDVFVWGGLASTPQRTIPIASYRYMYGTHPDNFRATETKYRSAAKIVCDNIRHRVYETQRLQGLEAAIKLLAQCAYIPDINSRSGYVIPTTEDIYSFICWFCETNKLVFNNKYTSIEEVAQCQKIGIGKALWDNYLMLVGSHIPEYDPDRKVADDEYDSEADEQSNSASKAAPEASAAETTSNSAPAQASAPQTAASNPGNHKLFRNNCNGLVDPQIGKLTNISNDGMVYWIGGEFSNSNGKTKPKLHVSPLAKGKPTQDPLKVKYTTGQGEDDCILFFASEGSAKNFLGIAQASQPATVKFLEVKKVKEDTNGYVEVITEFGNAYIKAYKLREEVEEKLEENKEENKVSNREICQAFKAGWARDM